MDWEVSIGRLWANAVCPRMTTTINTPKKIFLIF